MCNICSFSVYLHFTSAPWGKAAKFCSHPQRWLPVCAKCDKMFWKDKTNCFLEIQNTNQNVFNDSTPKLLLARLQLINGLGIVYSKIISYVQWNPHRWFLFMFANFFRSWQTGAVLLGLAVDLLRTIGQQKPWKCELDVFPSGSMWNNWPNFLRCWRYTWMQFCFWKTKNQLKLV